MQIDFIKIVKERNKDLKDELLRYKLKIQELEKKLKEEKQSYQE